MLSYKEAVEEFGPWIADMMLETEYNQYIRGCGYISKRKHRPEDTELWVDINDAWEEYEKLH